MLQLFHQAQRGDGGICLLIFQQIQGIGHRVFAEHHLQIIGSNAMLLQHGHRRQIATKRVFGYRCHALAFEVGKGV